MSAFDPNPQNEVPLLGAIASVLGVPASAISGQTEVPLLRLILGGITTVIQNMPSGGGSGDMLKATYDPANIAQQLVGTTATQTLTGKTFNLAGNTLTGTKAEFNIACSDNNFAFLDANIFTGQQTISLNGAASTPPLILTGTWFTGGSATTTKPQLLIEPDGTTSTAWSTGGTGLGINAPNGFTGRLLDLQKNGVSLFSVNAFGQFTTTGSQGAQISGVVNSSSGFSINGDAFLNRKAAATFQLGADAAGVTNQMLTAANRITSDGVGANLTIAPGNGRGGAGGSLILSTFTTGGAGVAGTLTPRLYVNGPNGLLQFGAQDNTAPALKRSTVELQCRLADDSDFADFSAKAIAADTGFVCGGASGVTAGPFANITSIEVVGGIVTDLQGS